MKSSFTCLERKSSLEKTNHVSVVERRDTGLMIVQIPQRKVRHLVQSLLFSPSYPFFVSTYSRNSRQRYLGEHGTLSGLWMTSSFYASSSVMISYRICRH